MDCHPENRKKIQINESVELQNLQIYTNGARNSSGVGCSFVLFFKNRELFFRHFRLGSDCTNFQAELWAVAQAVKWICCYTFNVKINICTDNKAVIQIFQDIFCNNPME